MSARQAQAVTPSIKDFEIIKAVSKSEYGNVYLSRKKFTGDYFAIKVLKRADMVAKNQATNVNAEGAIVLEQEESPFVAKLYSTFSSKHYLYLIMDYYDGGDCASLIKVLCCLPEDWAKKYLGEVILGVEYLHSRGIVHRDLKPGNLLIDQKGHLKLTDIGLSRLGLIDRQKRMLNSGTSYSAPDLLKQSSFLDRRSSSTTSSRSSSFDFHRHNSRGSTPQMTPNLAASMGQPSYSSLHHENSLNRETRHSSGYRSDSGGSDTLIATFSSFSLKDSQAQQILNQRKSPIKEINENEANGSLSFLSLQRTSSQSSFEQDMEIPPSTALFDPNDTNRRFVGTPDYLVPETAEGVRRDETGDWWSVGCILFEFLYGFPPFCGETPDQVVENVLAQRITWPVDDECEASPDAKDLINRLLCADHNKRLGANKNDKFASGGEEIRKHQWFADINWETLLQDEAHFVPMSKNIDDTEYFYSRGTTLKSLAREMEGRASPFYSTPGNEYAKMPNDALSETQSQFNSITGDLKPLHILPHVRDMKIRRLSEPVETDDFGNFTFRNLPVLEKANKDVIRKLRAQAMAAEAKPALINPVSGPRQVPSPIPEGSPVISTPIQRALSKPKATTRPSSPPGFSQYNSSPSRAPQSSSPLLVSFVETKIRGSAPALVGISPQKSTSEVKRSTSSSRDRPQAAGSQEDRPIPAEMFSTHRKRRSQVFDMSPSSSDNEDDNANTLLRVPWLRHSSHRPSRLNMADGPAFRPLDVLICDDHPVSRFVMEKLFEKLRCRTVVCSNGTEALQYAMSQTTFDIIMMEFKIPQINGADVARMIRETTNVNSQTPIVAITGYLNDLQAPHHFDDLIEKPPTTSKLTAVLHRLCQWKAPSPGQVAVSSLGHPILFGLESELVTTPGERITGFDESAITRPRSTASDVSAYSQNNRSAYMEVFDSESDLNDGIHELSSIERDIKFRNEQAYRNLRAGIPADALALDREDPTNIGNSSASGVQAHVERPTSKIILSSVPPSQLGLKVLNPETVNVCIDIIAVHGLGAIPDITWKESRSGVNWLSDSRMLPKAVPEARIMRFGYDSLWLGKEPLRTKLSTIANKLLLVLNRERVVAPERPLIFIGHCFGGLVIQRALIISKLLESSFPNIFNSSVGVIFLGTPHRGTEAFLPQSALLAAIASQSDLQRGLEPGVLNAMISDRGALLDVSDDFAKLCGSTGLLITCFFEQRESSLGKVIGRNDIQHFIVDEASASIDGHPSYGLPLDHFRLNKFSDPEDGNYKDLCGEITRFYQKAKQQFGRLTPDARAQNIVHNSEEKVAYNYQHSQTYSSLSASGTMRESMRKSVKLDAESANYTQSVPERKSISSRLNLDAKATAHSYLLDQISPLVPPERSTRNEEEDLRKMAIEELKQEEASKEAAMKEEEWEKMYQERVTAEMIQKESERVIAKEESEQRYKDRLMANMKKYGVQSIEKIVNCDPLPNDKDLSPQEIREKDRWYKNRVKAALVEYGLPDGQIDEILNDTGETMMIDGVRTTYTKMALKWLSIRTLKRYDVPFQIDESDPSTVIIKRWVPEYEQEFLWDHTRKLREVRNRHGDRRDDRKARRNDSWPDAVYDQQTKSASHGSVSLGYNREETAWSRRKLGNLNEGHRQASIDSIRSAPNTDEIARRRRHSRTLSEERPLERTQSQRSYDSARSPRESRRDDKWTSDTEAGSGRKSGVFSAAAAYMGSARRRGNT